MAGASTTLGQLARVRPIPEMDILQYGLAAK
jgi:hypothetical protein